MLQKVKKKILTFNPYKINIYLKTKEVKAYENI